MKTSNMKTSPFTIFRNLTINETFESVRCRILSAYIAHVIWSVLCFQAINNNAHIVNLCCLSLWHIYFSSMLWKRDVLSWRSTIRLFSLMLNVSLPYCQRCTVGYSYTSASKISFAVFLSHTDELIARYMELFTCDLHRNALLQISLTSVGSWPSF